MVVLETVISGWILVIFLKVKSTEIFSQVGYEEKRGDKDVPEVFVLINFMGGTVIN